MSRTTLILVSLLNVLKFYLRSLQFFIVYVILIIGVLFICFML